MIHDKDEPTGIEDAPFKLAFRTEGNSVNCYLAPMHQSHGERRLVSCMPLRVLQSDPQIWEDWKALMKRVIALMCREALGVEPIGMTEQTAPECERSGNG